MAKNENDRRVRRTEKTIRRTFEEMLMEEKQPITVAALARRADINRKTFYLHYDTMDDLVATYIDDAKDDLLAKLNAHSIDDYFTQKGLLLSVFEDFFLTERDFYSYILFQEDYMLRVRQLEDELDDTLAKKLVAERKMTYNDARLLVTFATSTMIWMTRLKISGVVDFEGGEMLAKISTLNNDGISGLMEFQNRL